MNDRILFTGGPGSGKTALITELTRRGYACVPEAARAIIQQRKRRGLSARPAPEEFARAILRRDREQYRNAPSHTMVFFDRGIPDALGMLDLAGLLTDSEAQSHLAEYPYFPTAFLFPPWREIFRNDVDRDQTYDEAVRIHDELHGWYVRCGFKITSVPPMTVPDRADFVMERIHALKTV